MVEKAKQWKKYYLGLEDHVILSHHFLYLVTYQCTLEYPFSLKDEESFKVVLLIHYW